jgi:hypothetical protein
LSKRRLGVLSTVAGLLVHSRPGAKLGLNWPWCTPQETCINLLDYIVILSIITISYPDASAPGKPNVASPLLPPFQMVVGVNCRLKRQLQYYRHLKRWHWYTTLVQFCKSFIRPYIFEKSKQK